MQLVFERRLIDLQDHLVSWKKLAFSTAIGYGELMHGCFPTHSQMGTARIKSDEETEEDGKKRDVSVWRSKAATKKKSPDGLSHPNTIQ